MQFLFQKIFRAPCFNGCYSLKRGKRGYFVGRFGDRDYVEDLCGDELMLLELRQEALNQAQEHGGKLVRWRQGDYWTYGEAVSKLIERSRKVSDLD